MYLQNIGEASIGMKLFKNAIENCEKSLKIINNYYGEGSIYSLQTLNSLGRVYE